MGYVYFTEEQKERANTVDLKDFLERQGERLLRSGPEWRMSSDHSITIRGNRWYDHGSGGKGGAAIDFVIYYYGKSFPDAVSMLLGGEQEETYRQSKKQEEVPRGPFTLPAVNENMRRVFAYLLKGWMLDYEVVSAFAEKKLIYESLESSRDGSRQYHNAIFVGYDPEGKARHAHKKGIYTVGKSSEVYVFEAPIDLLSYISLNKAGWKNHSYVSLCLDHDEAGMEAAVRIQEKLTEAGYLDTELYLSHWKDWNEDLKAAHGMVAVPAEEKPPPELVEEKMLQMA